MKLTAVRLPLPMEPVGIVLPARFDETVADHGTAAWAWEGGAPDLPIDAFDAPSAPAASAWGLDHVVVTTPDMEATVRALVEVGCDLRRHGPTAKGATAAFLLAGTLIEVIDVPSSTAPRLAGIALETDLPLHDLAARWRASGFEVADPHPAVQRGRMIMSVRGHRLAVMTRR